MFIREADADISVTIDGKVYGDSWATAEGGDLEGESSKTRPGGLGDEVAVGGLASRSDLTVTTQWTDVTAGWETELEGKIGRAAKVGVSWLNRNKTPTGRGKTIRGVLQSVASPDTDHDSSDVGYLSIVISCDETAA